jgi:hypothetical protein
MYDRMDEQITKQNQTHSRFTEITTIEKHVLQHQGQPLGGASGALSPGADFEGAPKRRSPTGHTLIRSTVTWRFPHLQTKRAAKDFFKIWLNWL